MAEYDAPLTHEALGRFVIDLASAGSGMRLCYAVSAGAKKPSAETWLRVVDLVARKGARAIAEAKPCAAPFRGLTEVEAA